MALMTIHLRRDPQTGRQSIIVKLDSDADALPMEHEQLHRQLVEKLLGKGLEPEDLGELIVEREAAPTSGPTGKQEPAAERKGQASGQ